MGAFLLHAKRSNLIKRLSGGKSFYIVMTVILDVKPNDLFFRLALISLILMSPGIYFVVGVLGFEEINQLQGVGG